MSEFRRLTKREAIAKARQLYADRSNDDVEVDDNAKLSRSTEGDGTWVQVWVWVRYPEVDTPPV